MKFSNIFSKNKNIKLVSSETAKKILPFGILILVLVIFFVPTHTAHAALFGLVPDLSDIISGAIKAIAYILMTISGLVLTLSGLIFDKVIIFTIVEMAINIGNPAGVGGAITTAWATLRDIANMCFIFVLLYAAFKTMFDTDFGSFNRTVRDIIIVALLINFSLFFSKVVIDASNIVAVGFYNSIANQTANGIITSTSISAGYMNMLGLQTFYDPGMLERLNGDPVQIITIGIMSSVFMLITAVILLIAGVMFAARFIILVFLMILSPLALIAYIIPGQRGQFEKWKDALIAQSFFAPVYFALTWVVFKLGNSLITSIQGQNQATGTWATLTTNPQGTMTLIFNYVIIIGFSIAALVISKSMATKTAGFKAISGGIGTAAIGGAALVGRSTLGRASGLISESQREKWSKSNLGRAGLWMADKGKKGSFDIRGSDALKKVPGLGGELGIMGKAGGKGGFDKAVKDKAEAKAKYAKEVYGQTAGEKEKAEDKKKDYEDHVDKNGNPVKGTKTLSEEAKKKHEAKMREEEGTVKNKEKEAEEAKKKAQEELEVKKKEMEEVKLVSSGPALEAAEKEVREAEEKLKATETAHGEAVAKRKLVIEDKKYSDAVQILEKEAELAEKTAKADKETLDKLNNAGKERQMAYAGRLEKRTETALGKTGAILGGAAGLMSGDFVGMKALGATMGAGVGASIGAKLGQGNKESARKVIEEAQGKAKKDKKQLKKDLAKMGLIDDEEGGDDSKKEKPEGGEEKKAEAPKTEEKPT